AWPIELPPGVDEVLRRIAAGHPANGFREEVEPRRVEAATERQVRVEPRAIRECRPVIDRQNEQNLPSVAGDEIHQRAHSRAFGSVARAAWAACPSAKSIMSRSPGDRPTAV